MDEQRTEAPLNLWKFVGGLATFGAVWFLLRDFSPDQRAVGAVFATTVVLWATEAMPMAVTALLSTTLLIMVAGVAPKTAFASYGDPIIPLFIGSFMLAKGIEVTGLNRRIAWSILRLRFATRTPGLTLLTLGFIITALSSVISNTATTAMMLPIVLSVVRSMQKDFAGKGYAESAMLLLTWSASVAVGTPVSTPPNLIGLGLIQEATGQSIGFGTWMMFAAPVSVLMLLGGWCLLRLRYRKEDPPHSVNPDLAEGELAKLGKLSPGERNAMIALGVAVFLWISPDVSSLVLGADSPIAAWFKANITSAVAALVAASLLFMLPAKGRFASKTITWREASGIDWGTIMLFGGGLALGQAMFASGLAERLGELAAQATGANSVWAITLLCIVAAVAASELASNTASATTLVPVAIGLAQGAEVSPIAPALGATIGASLGFMLPVSTAPNAIVYGTGLVKINRMISNGVLFDILGIIVVFTVLRIMLPLLGLV